MPSDISEANLARLGERRIEVLKLIDEEISKSERALKPWKEKIIKYNDLYRLVQRNRHYQGLSDIFVPEILRAVETVTANLYKALTGINPWFEYIAIEEEDKGSALANTLLVRSQMEENGFKVRTMDSIRQMVITGLTIRKLDWDFEQILRKKPNSSKEAKKRFTTFVDVTRDHWALEPVDLLGFHISDVNTPYYNIGKCEWIAEQYFVGDNWLQEKSRKNWIVKGEATRLKEKSDRKRRDSEYKRLTERRDRSTFARLDEKEGYEIVERWGLCRAEWVFSPEELEEFEFSPDDLVESVIIVGNRDAILKLEANIYWHGEKPYLSCPYIAQEFTFAGIGVSQIGEKMQEELNDTRNQTMDNKTLILMNMWLRSNGSGISKKQLRIRPMGVIDTNDINGLVPLRPPVLTGVGVNLEGVIKEDIRQSVGAASNLQGISQAGVDTATESTILNREAYGRLAHTAEMYGELVIKKMLTWVQYLNYQFYDRAKVIQAIGAQGIKFIKVSPEKLIGNMVPMVHLSTDSNDNPAVHRQQFLQFFAMIREMPPELIEFHWHSLNMVYKQFFPSRDLSELYTGPERDEELMTPEEEFDVVINGGQIKVHRGDNDEEHNIKHIQDFEATKFALDEQAFNKMRKHIMEHEAAKQIKIMEQQQRMMAAVSQAAPEGKLNTGQIPNGNAFNQKPATKQSDLIKTNGAGPGA